MASIDQARSDVQCAVERAIQWADRDDPTKFHEFETGLWSRLLALGRALVVLFLARQAARSRAKRYEYEGRTYVLAGQTRTSELGTRCGKVSFIRPIGRRLGFWRRAKADLPVDRELGLCGGFSLGTVVTIAHLCAQMAFSAARSTFREFSEWAPSSRTTLRMVDAIGDQARPFLEQATTPDDDGEVMVVLVDARGAPMIGSVELSRRRLRRAVAAANRRAERKRRRRLYPRPRRTKGKKSKNAKGAFVGVIYTLRRTDDGFEGPVNKRLYATFESHRALFVWLRREADKRGYGRKRCIFLADGSDHIWDLQQEFFPDAEPCIDWYHIVEKLWEAGACLHREGSDALQNWVHEQKRLLRRGKASQVMANLSAAYAALPKTGPGAKSKRKRLLEIMMHISKNQHRMHYDKLRRDDLPIGSGAVEGAVRNLVGMRLDGPGMRWGRDRSEKILHLRCIHLNGQWAEFVAYLSHRDLTLAAQPRRADAHDAVAKEAA
jgi:hypothetical protein